MADMPPLEKEQKREIMQGLIAIFGGLPKRPCLREIFKTVRKYRADRHNIDDRPGRAAQNKALKALQTRVAQLQKTLEQLDDATRATFTDGPRYPPLPEQPILMTQTNLSTGKRRANFLLRLDDMLRAFGWELRCLRLQVDKGGHPAQIALGVCVRRLEDIYKAEYGEKLKPGKKPPVYQDRSSGEYTGEFFHFVEACLKPIAPEVLTDSFGKFIERAVRKRRSTGQNSIKNS